MSDLSVGIGLAWDQDDADPLGDLLAAKQLAETTPLPRPHAIAPYAPTMLAFEWTEGGALLEVTCSDHGKGPARFDPLTELWLCDRGAVGCWTYVTSEHVRRSC